ncbi:MAG: PEP-utilizing enzyme [Actinomycetota bacterium]|nr:PEP-utilizing enzyme [Actinomycetota bacterium]MDQ3679720.1 PEP-utilizing enzyme [Actinomycetota bacterium]
MGLTCRISSRRRCPGHAPGFGDAAEGAADRGDAPPRFVPSLDEDGADDPRLAGRKAANLATARRLNFSVVPGFVVTTAACSAIGGGWAGGDAGLPPLVSAPLKRAWSELSADGERALVVRSSSPGEDGATSSMAGQFTSVLGVTDWRQFLAALAAVLESARVVVLDGVDDGATPMAVLVQQQVFPAWGGVLFGVDPVTGRTDRLAVAAVRGGPDQLVSGTVDGVRYTLTRHGHLLSAEGDESERLPAGHRRSLARLAARAERAFGAKQDIEWAYSEEGDLLLLQSRPVTAVGVAVEARGPVLGPGPVAETFPDPLAPLEQDLWLPPLRQALTESVRITGAVSRRRLGASPVIASPGGWVAADLELLGMTPGRSLWSRLDPRPPARRLVAAWRTGRIRAALPGLARDVVGRVDAELASVPPVAGLTDEQLLALLRGSGQALLAVHGYEILSGMLSTGWDGAPTSAATALKVVADGRARGLDDASIVARHPVVLSLVPPAIGVPTPLPPVAVTGNVPEQETTDPLAAAREDLRLRIRWVHELTARVAGELGSRLARRDLLPDAGAVRWLDARELEAVVTGGVVPDDLDARPRATRVAPLPAALRLTAGGDVVPVHQGGAHEGQGAGGGRALGPVHGTGPPEAGEVLVVRTLDPGLAAVLPGLAGLVAETGSVLSHLAILARELGVPAVVGVHDALGRFPAGSVVVVDGTTGEVRLAETVSP